MPYDSLTDLPDAVKDLPEEAQKIWRSTFNSAWETYADQPEQKREGTAASVAWAAVDKAGFGKGHMRAFSVPPHQFADVKKSKDGSAIFYGAVMFAKGSWVDANSGQAFRYTDKELAKTISQWDGIPIWNNHPSNKWDMHDPVDHMGTARNSRLDGGMVKGDLFMHGQTQASRDAIGMWAAGELPDLSSELTSTDIKIGSEWVATNIMPSGVAWVLKGACTVCKIQGVMELQDDASTEAHNNRHAGASEDGAAAEKSKGGSPMGDKEKELQEALEKTEAKMKELRECRDAAEASKKELAAKVEEGEGSIAEKEEALKAQGAELEKAGGELKEMAAKAETLEARVKELEAEANPKSKRYSGGEGEKKELISQFVKDGRGKLQMKEMV